MIRYSILFFLLMVPTILVFGQNEESTEQLPVNGDSLATFIQPRFPGCEKPEIPGKYKYLCSQKKFVAYLDRVIKYPKDARDEGVQGKVIITFIVEKDGSLSDMQVERSPDERLSEASLKALAFTVEDDYIWSAATLDGEKIRSMVKLPIDFRLGYKSIKSKRPITYINIPDIMESAPVGLTGKAMLSDQTDVDTDKVYDDVEKNPYFKGCDAQGMSLIDRYKCSRSSYYSYIDKQINYPEAAKADRIQWGAKVECVI